MALTTSIVGFEFSTPDLCVSQISFRSIGMAYSRNKTTGKMEPRGSINARSFQDTRSFMNSHQTVKLAHFGIIPMFVRLMPSFKSLV